MKNAFFGVEVYLVSNPIPDEQLFLLEVLLPILQILLQENMFELHTEVTWGLTRDKIIKIFFAMTHAFVTPMLEHVVVYIDVEYIFVDIEVQAVQNNAWKHIAAGSLRGSASFVFSHAPKKIKIGVGG